MNLKKIEFLKRNKELQNIITTNVESSSAIPKIQNQMDKDKAESTKLKDTIQQEVLNAEVKMSKTENILEKELIAYYTGLQRI